MMEQIGVRPADLGGDRLQGDGLGTVASSRRRAASIAAERLSSGLSRFRLIDTSVS